jgi:hypothetical protein
VEAAYRRWSSNVSSGHSACRSRTQSSKRSEVHRSMIIGELSVPTGCPEGARGGSNFALKLTPGSPAAPLTGPGPTAGVGCSRQALHGIRGRARRCKDRVEAVGQCRWSRLQNQRRLDLDYAVVGCERIKRLVEVLHLSWAEASNQVGHRLIVRMPGAE